MDSKICIKIISVYVMMKNLVKNLLPVSSSVFVKLLVFQDTINELHKTKVTVYCAVVKHPGNLFVLPLPYTPHHHQQGLNV